MINRAIWLLSLILMSGLAKAWPQSEKEDRIRTVLFYNVENLFDIENDSTVFDDDYTPGGRMRWTHKRYEKKIANISRVLFGIRFGSYSETADIIGLCEVENKKVVEDLLRRYPTIKNAYGIIHLNSPDERGIDVALLYKRQTFIPNSFKSHRLVLFNEDDTRNYTRDQLVVGGWLDGESFHFLVNHWPSRSGGTLKSNPYRMAAARLQKRLIDSIFRVAPNTKVISMGDFNDNPTDKSMRWLVKKRYKDSVYAHPFLLNAMEKSYKKGFGTLAYRDTWSLFDQFLYSDNLNKGTTSGFAFSKAGIYNASYLITSFGREKGYPFRTFSQGIYHGGYSDHFPIFLVLVKNP